MKQKLSVDLSLPLDGIISEAGASRVEGAIQRLPGVSRVRVDPSAGRVDLSCDLTQVDIVDFQYALEGSGCAIPTSELTLSIEGMHCLTCISHVQGALTDLPGVVDASASLSDRMAKVRYVPPLVSPSQMIDTVNRAGYVAVAHSIGSPTIPESRSSTAIRLNRWLYWLSHRWIAAISLVFGFYVVLPFLAPVMMAVGAEAPAKIIYTIFSFLCHQFPQRSFFLFGQQFMYPLSQFTETLGRDAASLTILRQFIGSPELGWKVAWSDRMVSMFTSTLIFAWLWYPLRSRLRGLSWQAAVLLLIPMAVDGFTHLISDLSGIGQGFRDTNAWLAALTNHAFSPSFYTGDALGSFNSLMRLSTGLLFGLAAVWFGFPYLDEFFGDIKAQIQAKFQRAGLQI